MLSVEALVAFSGDAFSWSSLLSFRDGTLLVRLSTSNASTAFSRQNRLLFAYWPNRWSDCWPLARTVGRWFGLLATGRGSLAIRHTVSATKTWNNSLNSGRFVWIIFLSKKLCFQHGTIFSKFSKFKFGLTIRLDLQFISFSVKIVFAIFQWEIVF